MHRVSAPESGLTTLAALAVISLALLSGCSEGPTSPDLPKPQFAVTDGAHGGGVTGLYFLPPMVPQPSFTGTFDADIATLNPRVAICDVTSGPDTDCGGATAAIIVFTPTSTPAITVDLTTPQYQVNWDTKGTGFVAGHTYRLHVAAGAAGARRELGFADVLLTTTPGQVEDLAANDLVVLKDGRTLPVHFRIETGIAGSLVVSAATASVATGGIDVITATAQDLHGALLPGATVAWTSTSTPATGVVASLTPTSGVTSAAGTTPTTLTAGATPGTATVTAKSGGLTSAVGITVVLAAGQVISVTAGEDHACALTQGGQAYCWGRGDRGELGNGATANSPVPVAVAGGVSFSAISAGQSHTCGLTGAGQAYCWGDSPVPSAVPVAVAGALSFARMSAGGNGHGCGLTSGGQAYCWGTNNHGQLGDGSFTDSPTPVAVAGGLSFVAVATGGDHTCALTSSGQPYCWGFSQAIGTPADSPVPYAIPGGFTFAAVTAGEVYACGLTAAGQAYCWNGNGSPVPVAAGTGFSFVQINAGWDKAVGVTASGQAIAWNFNGLQGVILPGTETFDFAMLVAGNVLTCGVTTGHQVYCFGSNNVGQLGNGSFTNSDVPVAVTLP